MAAVAAAAPARPRVLQADAPLLSGQDRVSVLSYNVLLPNSSDGWWIYKFYGPETPDVDRTWPRRQKLLQQQLLESGADAICLQECCADSFESDWAFLKEAGYLGELHGKGRMRCATFWRGDRLRLIESAQKDRSLVSHFELCGASQPGTTMFVINCHLAAGPQAPRRLRQVHEATETVRKTVQRNLKKLGAAGDAGDARKVPVIVCGDLNSQGHSAVHELLTAGSVGPDFRESGDATESAQEAAAVTSKVKKQVLGRFEDAYVAAYGAEPPPSMVCADLMDSMVDSVSGKASPALREAVRRLFNVFSEDGTTMSSAAVDAWLVRINQALGRGSEFRAAQALLAAKKERGEAECLAFEDLLNVYEQELSQGKFWGIEHDIALCTGAGLRVEGAPPFTMRFDHIFYTADVLQLEAVRAVMTEDQRRQLLEERSAILPCSWHPSDHLPVAAVVALSPAAAGGQGGAQGQDQGQETVVVKS